MNIIPTEYYQPYIYNYQQQPHQMLKQFIPGQYPIYYQTHQQPQEFVQYFPCYYQHIQYVQPQEYVQPIQYVQPQEYVQPREYVKQVPTVIEQIPYEPPEPIEQKLSQTTQHIYYKSPVEIEQEILYYIDKNNEVKYSNDVTELASMNKEVYKDPIENIKYNSYDEL